MRNLIISLVLIVIAGWILSLIGPWWSPLIVVFINSAARTGSLGNAFLVGGTGMLLLWLIPTIYLNVKDVTGLSAKMASLFTESVPALEFMQGSTLSYVIIIVLAMLLGGLAGLSGAAFKKVRV